MDSPYGVPLYTFTWLHPLSLGQSGVSATLSRWRSGVQIPYEGPSSLSQRRCYGRFPLCEE